MQSPSRKKCAAKLADIQEFLAQKRFAFVGVSRSERDFSRAVMREFETRGYDVVPVNPGAAEIAGRPCFARVQEVTPPVDAALLFTPPNATQKAIGDCVGAGVRHIWIRRDSPDHAWAVALCREQDIKVVADECPLMFLPNSGFVHRFHGMITKITGAYPR